MAIDLNSQSMPVVPDLASFDRRSGSMLERAVFNHRWVVLLACALVSVFLGWQALHLRVNASFDEMLPQGHPYMRNFLDHRLDLTSMGATVRIVVENAGGGDIYDPHYLEVLREVTDRVMVSKGVQRGFVKSLWLPSVRWTDAVQEGYMGGSVMPSDFTGQPKELDMLRLNVQRAQLVGSLVATDLKSSMIVVPLLDKDPDTGKQLDYGELFRHLNKDIKSLENDKVNIRMVGFPVLIGFLIDGLHKVLLFFAVAVVLCAVIIYAYTRCLRSTALLVSVSLLGVVWLIGLVALRGHALNPYSILVPFLIFAIGISHGAQKMNGVMQDIASGTHRYVAARYTFRRLFLAGLTALLTNVLGFAVLMLVDIPVIREMVQITSVGVLMLVFTKLLLIPVALSYIGVDPKAAARRLRMDEAARTSKGGGWLLQLARFTKPGYAHAAILTAVVVAVAGLYIARDLQVGDLDAGAPELWPNSVYNKDVAFVNSRFGLSSDQMAVIVKMDKGGASQYDNLLEIQRLSWLLRQDPDVRDVVSLATEVPKVNMGQFEASPKWMTIPRGSNAGVAVDAIQQFRGADLLNYSGSVVPVVAYLVNHKAETLARVMKTIEQFASEHNSKTIQFLPVAGSAGIDAVTNVVVHKAHREMLVLVYLSVVVLCFITFRSWRAVLVALIPLLITSVIAEALMVQAGIGLKVATLPVHALGVGVGVDYALYLLSVQLMRQRNGYNLRDAYSDALQLTGRVVALIGVTMAVAVICWVASPIKFQADMGLLLAFMFLWNMVGALVLIPALSYFLLPSRCFHGAITTPREPLQDGTESTGTDDGVLPNGRATDVLSPRSSLSKALS